MKRPDKTIYRYTNLPSEFELHAVSAPMDEAASDDEKHHVRRNGMNVGFPGYGRQGAMTTEQIDRYIGGPIGTTAPQNRRDVAVFGVRGDQSELMALGQWGDTIEPKGLELEAQGLAVGHVNVFTVARETRHSSRLLDDREMWMAGTALAHSLAFDAAVYNMGKILFKEERCNRPDFYEAIGRIGLSAPNALDYDEGYNMPLEDRLKMTRTLFAFDTEEILLVLPRAEGSEHLIEHERIA